jgi:hypothetical protein
MSQNQRAFQPYTQPYGYQSYPMNPHHHGIYPIKRKTATISSNIFKYYNSLHHANSQNDKPITEQIIPPIL